MPLPVGIRLQMIRPLFFLLIQAADQVDPPLWQRLASDIVGIEVEYFAEATKDGVLALVHCTVPLLGQ
jgi:hypothetical protein